MIFETERLILRPFTAQDAPLILRISGDPETTKYLCHFGNAGSTPESDTRRFLARAIAGEWEYCLVKKDTGEAIGDGSLEKLDDDTAEIGWILLPPYRKQGYAHEMAEGLLAYGFLEMGVSTVIAQCDARNIPSRNVMERLHMRLTSLEPQARPEKRPGEPKGDECTYSLSKAEWLSYQRKDM